jgi:hypothetical protein
MPSGAPVADCGVKLRWSAGGECRPEQSKDRTCGRKFVIAGFPVPLPAPHPCSGLAAPARRSDQVDHAPAEARPTATASDDQPNDSHHGERATDNRRLPTG